MRDIKKIITEIDPEEDMIREEKEEVEEIPYIKRKVL
jgi:hypothetical protein